MKNRNTFTVLFVIINIIGMAVFISVALSSWSSSKKLNSIVAENAVIEKEVEVTKSKIDDLERQINETLSENNRLKTMRMNKFSYFAPGFISNMFASQSYFVQNCESMITSSSIEGNTLVSPANEYHSLTYYKGKGSRISGDMIYLYTDNDITDSPGDVIGVKLYFRKNQSGNWKLYKLVYEGC